MDSVSVMMDKIDFNEENTKKKTIDINKINSDELKLKDIHQKEKLKDEQKDDIDGMKAMIHNGIEYENIVLHDKKLKESKSKILKRQENCCATSDNEQETKTQLGIKSEPPATKAKILTVRREVMNDSKMKHNLPLLEHSVECNSSSVNLAPSTLTHEEKNLIKECYSKSLNIPPSRIIVIQLDTRRLKPGEIVLKVMSHTIKTTDKTLVRYKVEEIGKFIDTPDNSLKVGDRIFEVNGTPVAVLSLEEVNKLLNQPTRVLKIVAVSKQSPEGHKEVQEIREETELFNSATSDKFQTGRTQLTPLDFKSLISKDSSNRSSNKAVMETIEQDTADEYMPNSKSFKFMDTLNLYNHSPPSLQQNFYCTRSSDSLDLYQVTLKCGPYGYGLSIVDGKNSNSGRIFVISIRKKGPAEKSKKIGVGDELIQINDKLVRGMNHKEVSELMMRHKGTPVVLTLAKKPLEECRTRSSSFPEEFYSPGRNPMINPRSTSLGCHDVRSFHNEGGYSFKATDDEEYFDHEEEDTGDQGSSSIPATNYSFEESVSTDIRDPEAKKGKCRIVELNREPRGFGFSFIGGVTGNRCLPFYIQSLSVGGPAMKSHLLHSGDQIIEINDVPITGMKHEDVLSLITGSDQKLKLKTLPK